MKTKSSLKKILFMFVLPLIPILWLYYIGFNNIKLKSQNISEMQYNLSNITRQSQYMNTVAFDVANSGSFIARIDNMIIAKDDDVSFIEKIETTAKNSGLGIKIDSLSVEDIPSQNKDNTSSNLTTLKVKITTNGSWQKTYNFLTELESLPFIVHIDKFALNNSSDTAIGQLKTGPQNWSAVIEMHVLKYK